MTSIEFLFKELWETSKDKFEWHSILEKAKEMHKQEIIEAQSYAISNADMTNNKGYFDCEQYYQETFGGKGSDEVKEESLVEKMIPHQLKYNLDVMEKLIRTSPQQEISDEEIEDIAWEVYVTDTARFSFLAGAKWYKQQLKQRQCNK